MAKTKRTINLQNYFERGLKAMGAQDYEGAAAWFAAIVEIEPTDKESLEFYEKNRMLSAQKGMNFFKRLGYQFLGGLTYGFGMHKAASHYLGILSMDKAHNSHIAAKYGKSLMAINQPALASLAFRRALKFLPKNKSILKSAGPAFEAIDDRPAAIEVYHQLSKLEPFVGAWGLKVKDLSAVHYGETGGITNLKSARADEEKKALQHQTSEGKEERIKELLAQYKEDPEGKRANLPEIGRLLMQLERYDNALPIWGRVIKLAEEVPEVPEPEIEGEGDEEGAPKKAKEAAATDDDLRPGARKDEHLLEEAMYNIALCQERKGDLVRAREGYAGLLNRFPSDPRYCDALYLVRLKEVDEEIREHPDDLELPMERERLEKEHISRKVDIFRKLVEKRPGDPDLLLSYGKVLVEAGELDTAIPIYQKASQNPARAYPALRNLGWLFIHKGQMPLAIDTFKRAMEKAPHSRTPTAEMKDIWYGLGEAYMLQEDPTNAKEWWKRIYETDIEFRDIRARYERLVA